MIVDDEPIARDILKKYISETPALELVKSCRNAAEAYEGLYEHAVDLIFLDIQMPVITGTDFLRSLRTPPMVIFTTAYSNYAMDGFELNSIDYLLKPISYERFYQAVQKVQERMATRQVQAPAVPEVDYIFLRQDSRLIRVRFSEIRYIEAEKDFSMVYLAEKKLLAGMHLKMLEDLLPQGQFLRVHRSFMVNLSAISSINGNMIEIGKNEIPIGASYKAVLLQRLGIA